MHILLSNDDGYKAPGLTCLAQQLSSFAQISVVAPERDRSGASNSLTLEYPIRVNEADNGFLFTNGTPTDCVHVAITGLLKSEPDMVISGINRGANLGDDVLYSGTVAAAMEGRFLGLPAIAVSLVGPHCKQYLSAAHIAEKIIKTIVQEPLPNDTILNVNVPDLPLDKIKGIQATRLGHRHKAEPAIKSQDPHGRDIYWVGPPGNEQDAGPGTDFYAIREQYVSVTPIQVDLTRHSALESMQTWVEKVDLK